jgi:hypothetical protein
VHQAGFCTHRIAYLAHPPLNKSSRVEADEGDSQSTVPAGRDITNEFRLASADDVQTLTIERLGEN